MVDIVSEYKSLLERKLVIETELPSLPKGSISNKTINGKRYCYLQNKSGGKVTSEYLSSEIVDQV